MPHTYTNLIYHIVFATKERIPFITNELKPRLYEYLGGIIRGLDGVLLEIGGMSDHLHLLIKLKPTVRFSDFMRELKTNSSVWANRITNGKFEWQNGYGAFTVGKTQVEAVCRYIQNQEAHHAKTSFDDEFKDLLNRSGAEFDERYLWK